MTLLEIKINPRSARCTEAMYVNGASVSFPVLYRKTRQLAQKFIVLLSDSFVLEGLSKIAQRFIAGFDVPWSTKPRRGGRNFLQRSVLPSLTGLSTPNSA